MSEKKSAIQDSFSALLRRAAGAATQIGESVKEQAEKGKDFIDEKFREREANEVFRKLGRKVYKLHSREELELPESCDKFIDALDNLLDADDSDDHDVVEEKPSEDNGVEEKSKESDTNEEKAEEVLEAKLVDE
ncbi:MAG: hypothetical protein WC966_02035 [Bradymonadales bacterium]|jgi:hypothetical protein